MRQVISSGSVRAFYLNKEDIINKLIETAQESLNKFPEIREVRLIGSLAKGEETGLSDIDIFLVADNEERNPIERMKPYFNFFSERIDLAIDMIVARSDEIEYFKEFLKESITLSKRPRTTDEDN